MFKILFCFIHIPVLILKQLVLFRISLNRTHLEFLNLSENLGF
jgi:hypothetical protein